MEHEVFQQRDDYHRPRDRRKPPPPATGAVRTAHSERSRQPGRFPAIQLPDPAPIYRGRTGESEQSLPCRPFIQYDSKTRTMNMKPALVDVPVLILFFNRPQQLSQVFEQVKKARPSRLFLYQDGARNEHDLPGIKACREIVSQIDWECEVERFYQERTSVATPRNIYRRNGLSQKSTNALYWKMMMCRQSLSSVSARKCWTSTNMTPASA